MLVIPVIDLLNGQVVRAIGGRRHEYQPWSSPIAQDSHFESVLKGLCEVVCHQTVYVADLDAITARSESASRPAYLDALVRPASCLLDRGFRGPAEIAAFVGSFAFGAIRPVFASESLLRAEDLPEMVDLCQSAGLRPVLSLDLNRGRPVASCEGWRQSNPLEIIDCAAQTGLSSVIVLDLADVGEEGGGSTHELCRAIRRRFPTFELIAGGGIRSYDDCCRYADVGCDAALVATSLHTGRLSREDCQRLERIPRRAPVPDP